MPIPWVNMAEPGGFVGKDFPMKRAFVVLLLIGAGYWYWTHRAPQAETPDKNGASGQAVAGQQIPPAAPTDPYALLASGKAKEAAAVFEAAMPRLEAAKSPDLPRATYHLGLAYLGMGNSVAAQRQFQRVLDQFVKDEHAGNALVQLAKLEPDAARRDALFLRAIGEYPRASELGPGAYDLGQRLLDQGKELEGWQALSAALRATLPESQAQAVRQKLDPIVKKQLFSAAVTPGATTYTVQSGDTLGKIARKHGVEVGMIKRANGMKSDSIYPNQRLKIVPGKWSIEVVLSRFRLTVFHEGRWVKDFAVGLGDPEKCPTPTGSFSIKDKLIDPPWKGIPAGAPANILGTRWMGLGGAPSYGIHGTTQPDTIGKPLSAGCVRMLNAEVEFLYDLVPVGTAVVIRD